MNKQSLKHFVIVRDSEKEIFSIYQINMLNIFIAKNSHKTTVMLK